MSFSKGFKVCCVDNSAEKACYDSSAIRLIFAPFVFLSFSFVWFSTHYSFHACAQITFTSVYLICQGTLSFMNIDNVHYCIMNVRLTVPNIYIGYTAIHRLGRSNVTFLSFSGSQEDQNYWLWCFSFEVIPLRSLNANKLLCG